MEVAVIGSEGRLGRLLCTIFSDAGHSVRGYDTDDLPLNPDLPETCDVISLAVPVNSTLDYIEMFGNSAIVVETTSVKSPLLGRSGRFVSIHPLFGPHSYPDNNTVCFIEDISRNGSARIVRELMPECGVLNMTAAEHDRLMAGAQVAPYILSLVASMLQTHDVPLTRSASLMNAMASVLEDESREVMMDTIRMNPNTPELLESVRKALSSLEVTVA